LKAPADSQPKCCGRAWGVGATTLEWTLPSPPPFHQYESLPLIR
jgi:cytochrome c oxidase subunit I